MNGSARRRARTSASRALVNRLRCNLTSPAQQLDASPGRKFHAEVVGCGLEQRLFVFEQPDMNIYVASTLFRHTLPPFPPRSPIKVCCLPPK